MNSLPSLFSSFSFTSKKNNNKNNENNNNIKSFKHNFLLFSSPSNIHNKNNNNNNNNNIKYIKEFEHTFYNNYYYKNNSNRSIFNSPIHYKMKNSNKKMKRKIKNYKIINENEEEFLSNIITEGNYQNINKNNKFNLSTDLNYDEKYVINNVINNNKSQNNKTLNVFYKKQSFNSPFNSKLILNCNNKIMKTLNDMRMYSQCNQFYKKINEVNKKNYFLNKMPKIRVSKFSSPETNFIFKNLQNNNNNILAISQNINNNNNNNTINSNNSKNNNNNNDNNNNNNNNNNNKNKKKLKYQNSINPLENILGIPNNLISRDKLFSSLRIFFTSLSTQLHPSSRGKFSFTLTEDFNLYIFGGIQSKCLNDLWVYNFQKNIWKKEEENENESPLPRYSHTMSYYNDNIYIFGGSISYQHLLIHNRENNISIFDTKTKKYYYPLCINSRNVPWRKNHIGIGVGNTLLIYGGINDEGEILNDFWVFEYMKLKWNPLEYRSLIKIPYLAYHSACLVIKSRAVLYHNEFNVYKIPEGNINKNVKNKPKIEGIYIFGGINNSDNINNNYFKDLFVIKIGSKPVDIFKIPTKGKMPLPRVDFSMSYYNYLNFLVIYGGKYEGVIINEIMFLDLETLSWIKPLYDENEISKISENIIICLDEKIYVLGGLGNEGFEKFEFNIINFDIFENNYNNNNINGIIENFSN